MFPASFVGRKRPCDPAPTARAHYAQCGANGGAAALVPDRRVPGRDAGAAAAERHWPRGAVWCLGLLLHVLAVHDALPCAVHRRVCAHIVALRNVQRGTRAAVLAGGCLLPCGGGNGDAAALCLHVQLVEPASDAGRGACRTTVTPDRSGTLPVQLWRPCRTNAVVDQSERIGALPALPQRSRPGSAKKRRSTQAPRAAAPHCGEQPEHQRGLRSEQPHQGGPPAAPARWRSDGGGAVGRPPLQLAGVPSDLWHVGQHLHWHRRLPSRRTAACHLCGGVRAAASMRATPARSVARLLVCSGRARATTHRVLRSFLPRRRTRLCHSTRCWP